MMERIPNTVLPTKIDNYCHPNSNRELLIETCRSEFVFDLPPVGNRVNSVVSLQIILVSCSEAIPTRVFSLIHSSKALIFVLGR